MERLLNLYDKESMKIAMLRHEETFKEQVYELHRLYRIQKMLMKNNRPFERRLERRNGVNYINGDQQNMRRKLDLERPAEEYIMDEDEDGMLEIDDESDIELTLGPTKFRQRKNDGTPLNSDTGPSFSSSSTESNTIKRTDTREELTGHEWGFIPVPNMYPNFENGKNAAFDVEEQLRQERPNQPPWLVQVLNLNMV